MAAPTNGPCADWIDAEDVFDCGPCASLAVENAALAAEVATAASRMLWLRSHKRYPGVCSQTVRPCRRCDSWDQPVWWGSMWTPAWGTCGCGAPTGRSCGCGGQAELTLGYEPLIAVSQVKVDGAVLAPTAYRVDDYRWLVRLDGEPWPMCQDVALADTQPDTFSVTFTWGRAVPEAGVLAAKALACELYQACTGGECRLPSRTRAVARQGVELLFHDPIELIEAGLYGIPEIDAFLALEDWATTHQDTVVVTPDTAPRSRRAT